MSRCLLVAFLTVGAFCNSAVLYAQGAAGPFNVRSYGAIGNGTTDDTNAFYLALAAVPTGGGEVYIPAGTYRLTQTLNVTTRSIAFRGEGQRLSVLRFEGPYIGDGIYFVSPSVVPNHTLTVKSLSILKSANGGTSAGGSGIAAYWPAITTTHMDFGGVTTTIEDVHIGQDPHAQASAYWSYGIYLSSAIAAKISKYTIRGPGATLGQAGIAIAGRTLGVRISDGDMSDIKRAFWQTGNSEGINISSCDSGGVEFGAVLANAGPGTAIANSHFNAHSRGISLLGAGDIGIINNLIYQGADPSAGFIGIEANPSGGIASRIRIIGNTIVPIVESANAAFGIALANTVTETIIQGNQIYNMDVGVYLVTPTVSNSIVTGNTIRNTTTPIANNGTNTLIANNCPNAPLCF